MSRVKFQNCEIKVLPLHIFLSKSYSHHSSGPLFLVLSFLLLLLLLHVSFNFGRVFCCCHHTIFIFVCVLLLLLCVSFRILVRQTCSFVVIMLCITYNCVLPLADREENVGAIFVECYLLFSGFVRLFLFITSVHSVRAMLIVMI